ncbi:MAG: hypothetical protein Fur0037_05460 [Planctomycetota bacterium]
MVAGASAEVRRQALIGASHLSALVGHSLTGIVFRRDASADSFASGAASCSLMLSTAPRAPLSASRTFAQNAGNGAVTVSTGTIALPQSPPAAGPVAWSSANTIRIAFQRPWSSMGGTICLDLVSSTAPGQEVGWWVADAAFDDVHGSTRDLGDGCGPIGGASGHWNHSDSYALRVGGEARFEAQGTAGDLGICCSASGPRGRSRRPLWGFRHRPGAGA